jgi:hypothetical protein
MKVIRFITSITYMEVKLHLFWTSELAEDKWPASRSGRFATRQELPEFIPYQAGWASDAVWEQWWQKEIPLHARNQTQAVQVVRTLLNDIGVSKWYVSQFPSCLIGK